MTDKGGRTPLSYAAERGRRGMVILLLEREEVNTDLTDKGGQTPLSYATSFRHLRCFELAARLEAARFMIGYGEVVEILLGRAEVNPNMQDNRGRTPLSYAAERGYQEMVALLLEREEVNSDVADNDGKTPLSFATRNVHNRVAPLLQSRKAVTPTTI